MKPPLRAVALSLVILGRDLVKRRVNFCELLLILPEKKRPPVAPDGTHQPDIHFFFPSCLALPIATDINLLSPSFLAIWQP